MTVPYEVPFIALTKAIAAQLANEQLARVERALEVHERLAHAVLEGRGAPALLAILGDHVGCSLALVDESGRVVGERHGARLDACEHVLELPVVADGEIATLRAGKPAGELSEYDRLVLHHGQTALAFELSRRHAVSAAELRLAGDLLEDLEHDRLDEREIARRISAFGLDPQGRYAALLAVAAGPAQAEDVRAAAARVLDARGARYLSAVAPRPRGLPRRDRPRGGRARDRAGARRRRRPALASASAGRARAPVSAAACSRRAPRSTRSPARSPPTTTSARSSCCSAFRARRSRRSSPACSARPSTNSWLLESLTALLDSGCRWSEAADRLGVHRHTLRYRMEQLRKQTGRHPDDPAQRMELWLAVKAKQALGAREGVDPGRRRCFGATT